ncbi:MAG: SseB family protein [Cellulomonadaceae bacterium]|jgi:hypothetical protein|nr:SseB family protein [Cellulomonadaceae bacterium]
MAQLPVPGANQLLELALAKYREDPSLRVLWEVTRQLGQGNVYTASIAPKYDALSPTAIPMGVVPESVLALPSEKGPLLALFTDPNGPANLPGEVPPDLAVRVQPGVAAAVVGAKEPYAGVVINPGSDRAVAIPAQVLAIGLPQGKTNTAAKNLLTVPKPSMEQRQAMVQALAAGPLYTAVARSSVTAAGGIGEGDAGKGPIFPLVPLDGSAPGGTVSGGPGAGGSGDDSGGQNGGLELNAGTPAALIFGTSPAEIAVIFDPESWVPIAVSIGDVLKAIGKSADIKLILVNPAGPSLHLPISQDDKAAATAQAAGSVADSIADLANADAELANSMSDDGAPSEDESPSNGHGSEPDGGTREGED